MARPNARARGYTTAWDKARVAFLADHPRCACCPSPATVVHHRRPHRGDMIVFWDRSIWQPRCAPCHDNEGSQEDRRGYSPAIGRDGLPSDPRHPFNQERA